MARRRPLDAPRVRVRCEVWSYSSDGTTQRMWRVVGPTGLEYAARRTFKEAVALADKESRNAVWRDAEGVHECTSRDLWRVTARYVAGAPAGIYCGHGRFIGEGDLFLVDGIPTRLGTADRRGVAGLRAYLDPASEGF